MEKTYIEKSTGRIMTAREFKEMWANKHRDELENSWKDEKAKYESVLTQYAEVPPVPAPWVSNGGTMSRAQFNRVTKIATTLSPSIRYLAIESMVPSPTQSKGIFLQNRYADQIFPFLDLDIGVTLSKAELRTWLEENQPQFLREGLGLSADVELDDIEDDYLLGTFTSISRTEEGLYIKFGNETWSDPTTSSGETFERFTQHVQLVGYSQDILLYIFNTLMHDRLPAIFSDYREEILRWYEELHVVASTRAYGNGTILGQIGRMYAVEKNRLTQRDSSIHYTLGSYKDRKYLRYIGANFPIGEVFYNLQHDNLFLYEFHKAFKINMTASAGPGHLPNSKKLETTEGDMFLATKLLIDCKTKTLEDLLVEWRMLLIKQLKAKDENYTIAQYGTNNPTNYSNKQVKSLIPSLKTRNYFPVNNVANLPAQVFTRCLFNEKTYFGSPYWEEQYEFMRGNFYVNQDKGMYPTHLLGWSPLKGGVHSLMLNLTDALESLAWSDRKEHRYKCLYLVYADNVFCMIKDYKKDKYTWVSMDGVKFESCIPAELVQNANLRYCVAYEKQTGHEVSEGIRSYMTGFYPHVACRGVSTIRDKQYPHEFLGSGACGTAYYNTEKMYQVSYELSRKNFIIPFQIDENGDYVASEFLNEVAMKVGAGMTVEMVQEDVFGDHELMHLDLLGYDAVYMHGTEGRFFVPVLNEERLHRAFLWQKKHTDKYGREKPGGEDQLKAALDWKIQQIVRLKVVYLLGGWYYPGYRILLPILLKNKIKSIRKTYPDELIRIRTRINLAKEKARLQEESDIEVEASEYLIASILDSPIMTIPLDKLFEILLGEFAGNIIDPLWNSLAANMTTGDLNWNAALYLFDPTLFRQMARYSQGQLAQDYINKYELQIIETQEDNQIDTLAQVHNILGVLLNTTGITSIEGKLSNRLVISISNEFKRSLEETELGNIIPVENRETAIYEEPIHYREAPPREISSVDYTKFNKFVSPFITRGLTWFVRVHIPDRFVHTWETVPPASKPTWVALIHDLSQILSIPLQFFKQDIINKFLDRIFIPYFGIIPPGDKTVIQDMEGLLNNSNTSVVMESDTQDLGNKISGTILNPRYLPDLEWLKGGNAYLGQKFKNFE